MPAILLKTGVYCVLNMIDGRRYVGSSVKSVSKRLEWHRRRLTEGKHPNRYLQAAWEKHGDRAFEFLVLERCEPERCLDREQHWIDECRAFGHGYNLRPRASNSLGWRASAEMRAARSKACKERYADPAEKQQLTRMTVKAVDKLRGKVRPLSERSNISEGTRKAMGSKTVKLKLIDGQRRRVEAYRFRTVMRRLRGNDS